MQSNELFQKSVYTIDDFLEIYDVALNTDIDSIFNLDFQINKDRSNLKLKLRIEVATEKDAIEITKIFKEVYNKTYPYKQMENIKEVRRMLLNPEYKWFLFRSDSNKVAGCFATRFEFKVKRGLLFGFVIKKEFQNSIDSLKAFIGCLIYVWKFYKDLILVWYGEVRTNDSTPQYATSLCGLKPIAFYPNKDIFFNKVESIFLHVNYDKKALTKFRFKKKPNIIRQVLNCYQYSNNRFKLDIPTITNPKIDLKADYLDELKNKLVKRTEVDLKNNKLITYSIKNSNSYFKFLYNQNIQTIEKIEYKVKNLETLSFFLEELKTIINTLHIRYIECFVSAYKPDHQILFFNSGFKPTGYIFSWDYDVNKNKFKDCIVFTYYTGLMDKNIKLIPESSNLIQSLNLF